MRLKIVFLVITLFAFFSGCLDEGVLMATQVNTTVHNNYTNVTGGGGVSFDGTSVNLNGSNMFNGTISNYSTLAFMNTSLNQKVNKTGDTMTGDLAMSGYNLNNVTRIRSEYLGGSSYAMWIKFYRYQSASYNQSQLTFAFNNLSPAQDDKAVYFTNSQPNSGLGYAFNTLSSYSISLDFNPYNVLTWRFGMDNDGYNFSITRKSGTGIIKMIDTNLTISALSGSGNDYACLDPNGNLFRSNTAC